MNTIPIYIIGCIVPRVMLIARAVCVEWWEVCDKPSLLQKLSSMRHELHTTTWKTVLNVMDDSATSLLLQNLSINDFLELGIQLLNVNIHIGLVCECYLHRNLLSVLSLHCDEGAGALQPMMRVLSILDGIAKRMERVIEKNSKCILKDALLIDLSEEHYRDTGYPDYERIMYRELDNYLCHELGVELGDDGKIVELTCNEWEYLIDEVKTRNKRRDELEDEVMKLKCVLCQCNYERCTECVLSDKYIRGTSKHKLTKKYIAEHAAFNWYLTNYTDYDLQVDKYKEERYEEDFSDQYECTYDYDEEAKSTIKSEFERPEKWPWLTDMNSDMEVSPRTKRIRRE